MTASTVVPADFYDRMIAALDNPPSPNDALTRAAKRLEDRVIRHPANISPTSRPGAQVDEG